jgi:hypothetical protein
MKKDVNKHYYCAGCKGVTNVLHEIFPGDGRRRICIDYNIQVPLCQVCHAAAGGVYTPHGFSPLHRFRKTDKSRVWVLDQDAIAEHFCKDVLDINYWLALKALNNKLSRGYLEDVKDGCGKKLNSWRL